MAAKLLLSPLHDHPEMCQKHVINQKFDVKEK